MSDFAVVMTRTIAMDFILSMAFFWAKPLSAQDPWTAVFAICLWLACFSFNASFIWREKK